ncbi:MAG: alpha-rhamnosidase [Bacteroidales bacterium]|nr:alpha-rhamnosidase [Bacteroidales bacterium]
MTRSIQLSVLLVLITFSSFALDNSNKEAKWIWYPGDFEVWLHTQVAGRRQERGQPYPPFWRVDSHYGVVLFEKKYDNPVAEKVQIFSDGRYHIRIDGVVINNFDPMNLQLPAGKHSLTFLVENYKSVPSILVKGENVFTDESWLVTNQDTKYYNAASGLFSDPELPPSTFHLSLSPVSSKVLDKTQNSIFVDFGKETFGKVIAENVKGKGKLKLFYGETKQEALAETLAETYDYLDVNNVIPSNDTINNTRAFRFIKAVWDQPVSVENISALYEYLPVENRGNFECSDTLLNQIYRTSLYTLHLNTREFHLDGIKRDRWVWSGDAYQSYLMNFYTFFDEEVNKRTINALRGHDPVERHINTILDYSFYWMIGIYDNYMYTGDTSFVRQIYPRMKTLMDFCLGRTNSYGFVEGLPGDWVFIDWAPIEKKGEVSFEQLLFCRSLEAMAKCSELVSDRDSAAKYSKISADLKQKITDTFWSDKRNAFLHARNNGVLSQNVTRYTNMFAILFDYVDAQKKQMIRENVILNDTILKITTPYMKFYELAALCEINEKEKVLQFVKDYWGGMLNLGATTVWEAYDPTQKGDEHYAMYGRPFGKSLCHAWGANPVYLFGKYLLGVKPLAPGYKTYLVEPSLAGLQWIRGRVPTPDGNIEVYADKKLMKIMTVGGTGILRLHSRKNPVAEKGVEVKKLAADYYEIALTEPFKEYVIKYW